MPPWRERSAGQRMASQLTCSRRSWAGLISATLSPRYHGCYHLRREYDETERSVEQRKSRHLKTHGELVAEEQNADAGFNAEWESLAIARAVAARLIVYRSEHSLTQRQLADLIGVPQPQVHRLESGEVSP